MDQFRSATLFSASDVAGSGGSDAKTCFRSWSTSRRERPLGARLEFNPVRGRHGRHSAATFVASIRPISDACRIAVGVSSRRLKEGSFCLLVAPPRACTLILKSIEKRRPSLKADIEAGRLSHSIYRSPHAPNWLTFAHRWINGSAKALSPSASSATCGTGARKSAPRRWWITRARTTNHCQELSRRDNVCLRCAEILRGRGAQCSQGPPVTPCVIRSRRHSHSARSQVASCLSSPRSRKRRPAHARRAPVRQ